MVSIESPRVRVFLLIAGYGYPLSARILRRCIPRPCSEDAPGLHPSPFGYEFDKKFEFGGGQMDGSFLRGDLVAVDIDQEIPDLNRLFPF